MRRQRASLHQLSANIMNHLVFLWLLYGVLLTSTKFSHVHHAHAFHCQHGRSVFTVRSRVLGSSRRIVDSDAITSAITTLTADPTSSSWTLSSPAKSKSSVSSDDGTDRSTIQLTSVLEKLKDLKILKRSYECDQLLRQFVRQQQDKEFVSSSSEKLLPLHFGIAIAAWANDPSEESPQKAEALWQLMKEHHISPTEATYNALMKVHLRHLQRPNQTQNHSSHLSEQRIEVLWKEMKQHAITPDTYTFSTLLQAKITISSSSSSSSSFDHSSSASFIESVEQIVQDMESYQVIPNLPLMTSIIQAYNTQLQKQNHRVPGNNNNRIILAKVEALVETMKQRNIKLDIMAYTCLLDTYAQCLGGATANASYSNNPNSHQQQQQQQQQQASLFAKALQVWEEIQQQPSVTPNERTYSSMIGICSKSTNEPRAMQMAEDLFDQLQSDVLDGILPNSVICNSMMKCYYQHNLPHQVERLFQNMLAFENNHTNNDTRLTDHSHAIRLHAWSKAGDPCMASAALNDMIHDESATLLSTIHFNTVLSAWLRSGMTKEAPDKALACLEQMKKSSCRNCRPDTISYNILISTLQRYRHPQASSRTMELLHEMEQSSDALPDLTTYCQTLQAQALSNDSNENAWEIVRSLEEKGNDFWMKEHQYPQASMRKKWSFVLRALQSSQLSERVQLEQALESVIAKAKATIRK